MTPEDLLQEQVAYYRARSAEYDEWFLRRGRYDRGAERNAQWFEEVEQVRAKLASLQSELPEDGEVLELACGTGLWTERLATGGRRVLAVDASSEVIHLNRERLGGVGLLERIDYEVADLFEWRPARRFDLVFFGFWLSHVPPACFERFWRLVGDALAPGGRVFFVDNMPSRASGAKGHPEPAADGAQERELNDGRRFRVVKVFYDPVALGARLRTLGFAMDVGSTPEFFLVGSGGRVG